MNQRWVYVYRVATDEHRREEYRYLAPSRKVAEDGVPSTAFAGKY